LTDKSTSPDTAPKKEKRVFGRTFWTLNTIEMWERLAYFSIRSVVPVYIMQADDPGGLHFTAAMKGTIYAWWAFFQSIFPIVTGGFADRYGYKKMMFLSVTMNIVGYVMMAYLRTYVGFFAGILVLATGTAFFKPSLQGSMAQSLTKKNSSVGWGIFYWVVNIGAAMGPFLATFILGSPHTQIAWRNLFLTTACITSLNYIMMFTFKDVPSGSSKTESFLKVLERTFVNIFEPRLIAWLLIMSCFWLMMYQLWDLHPNFIEDWVDSQGIAAMLPVDSWKVATDRGVMVPQQLLLNLNAIFILLFMVPLSWVVRKMRVLECMIIGMVVATIGIMVAGFTSSGWVLALGIVFFSSGEMMTGPKKNEYLGLIAPPGKKGLYLGYVNIPVGIGIFAGSKLAGYVYGHFGEKATLALKYLAQHTPFGADKNWDGSIATLESALGVPRTEAMLKLQEVTGWDAVQATKVLWDTYNPQYHVWIPFAAIGFTAIIALVIFNRMAKKWSDMNA
jgi:proton-dependent oligopeptide transporter, POT family